MDESSHGTGDLGRWLDCLLERYSPEHILDDLLGRIPTDDLCQAMLRVFEGQNTVMSSDLPRDVIMCSVGLGSTSVSGCSSSNINVQPFEEFRLDRLIISSRVAGDFLITDIKVGKESQFDSPGAIPGTSFTEDVFAIKLRGDLAMRREFITVSVTNQTGNAQNFQGVLIGHIDRKPQPGKDAVLEIAA